MTHTVYTKKILRIEDNKEYNIFHGYLTYNPEYCVHYGCVNNGTDDIIKWAFDKNCLVKIPKVSNYNTILLLDKQRFHCKHCKRTFSATTIAL